MSVSSQSPRVFSALPGDQDPWDDAAQLPPSPVDSQPWDALGTHGCALAHNDLCLGARSPCGRMSPLSPQCQLHTAHPKPHHHPCPLPSCLGASVIWTFTASRAGDTRDTTAQGLGTMQGWARGLSIHVLPWAELPWNCAALRGDKVLKRGHSAAATHTPEQSRGTHGTGFTWDGGILTHRPLEETP